MRIATLQFLPRFILDNPDIAELLEAEQIEIDYLSECIELLRMQTTVSTSSIYLDRYEQIMAMDISPSLSDTERIGRILAKLNTRTTATPEAIKTIVRSFTGSDTYIEEHFSDYSFLVFIKRENDQVIRMKDIRDAIDVIKPAHLAYQLSVRFPVGIGIRFRIQTYHIAHDVCGDTGMSGDFAGEYPQLAYIGTMSGSDLQITSKANQHTYKHRLTGESPFIATVGALISEQIPVEIERTDFKTEPDQSSEEAGIYPIVTTIGKVYQVKPAVGYSQQDIRYDQDMGLAETGTEPHTATLGVVQQESGLIEARIKNYATEVSFASESDFDEEE